jgi:hypothetical protein
MYNEQMVTNRKEDRPDTENDHEVRAFGKFVEQEILTRQVQGRTLARQADFRGQLASIVGMIDRGELTNLDAVQQFICDIDQNGHKNWQWVQRDWRRYGKGYLKKR